jgi:hypothetical protein
LNSPTKGRAALKAWQDKQERCEVATNKPTEEEKVKQQQKQEQDNLWEAIKFVWQLTDDAAWKITKIRKFLTGKVTGSKTDKRYGQSWYECQLSEDPSNPIEIVGFYHWYKFTYHGASMPEKGETLLNYIMTFRGSEKYVSYMEKGQRTIMAKIPKIILQEMEEDEVVDEVDEVEQPTQVIPPELKAIMDTISDDEIDLPPIPPGTVSSDGSPIISDAKRLEAAKMLEALSRKMSGRS